MKNQLLIFLLAFLAACGSSKHSTSPSQAAAPPAAKTPASRPSPPVVEHHERRQTSSDTFTSKSMVKNASMEMEYSLTSASLPMLLQFKYAILLDVPVETITDVRLFSFIENWYGTRYKYGGCNREGVDCSAFARFFMDSVFNVLLPRTSSDQYRQSKRIKKPQLREGDLVFFHMHGKKAGITHVGVYLRNNKFVHASIGGGVMIDDLAEDYYTKRYAGAGRVRG